MDYREFYKNYFVKRNELESYGIVNIYGFEFYDYWNLQNEPMEIGFKKKDKSFSMTEGKFSNPNDYIDRANVNELYGIKRFYYKHFNKIKSEKKKD